MTEMFQAALESAIAHAQKRLIDVKVGQWMLKRVQLKQKLAPHRSKVSLRLPAYSYSA